MYNLHQHSNFYQTTLGGVQDSKDQMVSQPQTTRTVNTLSDTGGCLKHMLTLYIHCLGEIPTTGISVLFPVTDV